MPSTQVFYEKATASLNLAESKTDKKIQDVIATPFGLTIVEIQGTINLPQVKPKNLNETEETLFIKSSIPKLVSPQSDDSKYDHIQTEDEIRNAVRFGKLELDADGQNATLFISTSQRLVGKVETLDPPLGVLRINKNRQESELNPIPSEIVDVITKKVVFRFRPLPIM
ncbi:unnamed protein product [[Candida] boidinii]|uniref:Unnamed protein product n=1 Tax=Candida boidinii TaxID=5477 RepID=A0A9W6WEU6_CANBO|nr:hypothetical protein B5S30_g1051 [[Candida] boidinii]OWB82376.1 hypothetical protein B5S33_g1001 [[Candida] boidinii]GME68502.1 unnamed protein product [[Candida] boidinii]GME96072.1 unnamed protein product [[Candida] boidinii]GMG00128.1 unnamed protein product [[Candida] boidinii]